MATLRLFKRYGLDHLDELPIAQPENAYEEEIFEAAKALITDHRCQCGCAGPNPVIRITYDISADSNAYVSREHKGDFLVVTQGEWLGADWEWLATTEV
jgi:hypothetical protein